MSEPHASPPALVITGMHRSGTSFAASLVHAAGLFLGDRLLPPHASNPLGHFEDLEFYEFDRRLLRAHGLSDDGFVCGPAVHPGPLFHAEAARLVDARRARGTAWGWKDPRAALLLEFWREVIPEARFLFVFRPPWDVVDSLYRRGDETFAANPPLALDVWRDINGLLLAFARRHPERVLVREVGQIAAAPETTLQAIRESLGVPVGSAASTFRMELLTPAPEGRADLVARLAPDCMEVWRMLRDLAGLPSEPAPMPSSIGLQRDRGLVDWQRLRVLERRVPALEQRAAVLEDRAARAEDQAATLAEQAAQADRAAAAAAALSTRLAEADSRAAAAATALAEAAARVTALEADVRAASAHETDAAELHRRIAALEATVTAIHGSTSWRLTAPLRAAALLVTERARPLARRLAGHARFLAARLASPAAARQALARGFDILCRDGFGGLARAVRTARLIDAHRGATAPARSRQPVVRLPLLPPRPMPPARQATSAANPLISIVMPVFDPPADVLEAALRSVLEQSSSRWELVVVDDASSARHVPEILSRHAARDTRIHVHRRATNGGIAAATNDGVARATGEFVAFLDHDDLLAPEAIARCAEALASSGAEALYTDQDTVDDAGRTTWTFHKPDWSPEYLRHVMYVGHLLVVRRSLAERLGFKSRFDGVQDFEFMLRLGESTQQVAHLPEVLYHWRAVAGSVARASGAKAGIDALQARAVQEHLDRLGIAATAVPHPHFPHRCLVEPRLARRPRVSLVIPSKDRPDLIGPCLDSILAVTRYPDVEVIVVDTGTTDPKAIEILRSRPVRVVPFAKPFNFSAASNAGAAAATGEILVFLNNDTTAITPDWLDHLAFHLQQADVGAVGPLLLYPDGSVQHAGVVLGARGTADHVMRRFPADADGYAGSLSCPREVSAVTGACLAIRRDVLDRIGGWNELYATHYQDVDLCLRLRRAGLRCLFTPHARLTHHESPSRGGRYDFLDRLLLIDSWQDDLAAGDPAYPAACSLDRLDYSPRDVAHALGG